VREMSEAPCVAALRARPKLRFKGRLLVAQAPLGRSLRTVRRNQHTQRLVHVRIVNQAQTANNLLHPVTVWCHTCVKIC
jgi:hypothetical protein